MVTSIIFLGCKKAIKQQKGGKLGPRAIETAKKQRFLELRLVYNNLKNKRPFHVLYITRIADCMRCLQPAKAGRQPWIRHETANCSQNFSKKGISLFGIWPSFLLQNIQIKLSYTNLHFTRVSICKDSLYNIRAMFGLSIFPFGKGSNKWVDCADAAQLDFFLFIP